MEAVEWTQAQGRCEDVDEAVSLLYALQHGIARFPRSSFFLCPRQHIPTVSHFDNIDTIEEAIWILSSTRLDTSIFHKHC